jgi:tripartite-type tricarboxylate transporter receptor subunit TctC
MSRTKRRLLVSVFALFIIPVLLGVCAVQAQAQSKYPAKAIDLIVPVAAGGTTDMWARVTADFLKKKWGVPINVVNKAGGGTVPGNLEVYQATPDGYTMLADAQSSCSFLEVGIKNLPFKVLDRTFIAIVAVSPSVIMSSPKFPWKNFKELVEEARKDPENFTWASTGSAGSSDILMRQFFKAAGVDVAKTKPVITRGAGEMNPLAAGGHVKMVSDAAPSAQSFVTGGMLRPLAITAYRMPDLYPDLATTAEQGYPGVNNVWWWGISGPPKLPPDVIEKWDTALQELLKDPEYVAKIVKSGGKITYQNSREAKERVRKEMDQAAELWGVK